MSNGNRSRFITLLALPISNAGFATNHPIPLLSSSGRPKHRIT
jgi:hypothetical protein